MAIQRRADQVLTIAIDYDDTLTRDAELWRRFIESAKELGHIVYCVTARRDTIENWEVIGNWMKSHGIDVPIVYSGLKSKVQFAKSIGIKVDIWIDDNPMTCAMGH